MNTTEEKTDWNKVADEYSDAVAEVRQAWEAIALKFDATFNGSLTNAPTKAEELRIARARAHLREVETLMREFMKDR